MSTTDPRTENFPLAAESREVSMLVSFPMWAAADRVGHRCFDRVSKP